MKYRIIWMILDQLDSNNPNRLWKHGLLELIVIIVLLIIIVVSALSQL